MHSFVLTACCLFVSELWWIWAIMTQLRSEVGRWWYFVYRVWGSATFHGCPDDSSERRGCRTTREREGMWLFVCFGTSSLKMNTFHVLGLSCHTRTMFYCILGFLGVIGGGQWSVCGQTTWWPPSLPTLVYKLSLSEEASRGWPEVEPS